MFKSIASLTVLIVLFTGSGVYAGTKINTFLSLLAITGVHALGHDNQGRELDVNVSINVKSFDEVWHTEEHGKRLLIHGAGFRMQSEFVRHFDNTVLAREMHKANVVYSIGYLLGINELFAGLKVGDIELISEHSGSKWPVVVCLTSGIISDFMHINDPKLSWSMQFWQSGYGVPGIAFNYTY
jgi:hypothetical protein